MTLTDTGAAKTSVWRNIILLALCHAVLITMFSALVVLSGIVSRDLAPNPALATLPFGCLTLTQLALCFFASQWMGKVGRRKGFSTGAILGIVGGIVLAFGLTQASFVLFCLGHALSGAAAAFGIYYRFAAVENAPAEMHNRAVSLVLTGGVIAAVLGPTLASYGRHLFAAPFVGTSLALAVFWGLALIAVRFLVETPPPSDSSLSSDNTSASNSTNNSSTNDSSPNDSSPNDSHQSYRSVVFIVAALCGAIAYGVMNLVMLATPLAMEQGDFDFPRIAQTIQLHILAMYVPSFFTGNLIDKLGLQPMMWIGVALLVLASATHFSSIPLDLRFPIGLIALGLGWNFLFVSASALVARLGTVGEKARLQGINEFVILLAVTFTAFASGWSFNAIGWLGLNSLVLFPLAVASLLLLLFARHRGDSVANPS
ncbi:MAG: MFS transporter [Alphaproteobacteria bacterium]